MGTAVNYLDFRANLPAPGNELGLWCAIEDAVNQFKEPVATEAILLTAEFNANLEPQLVEDEQRRSGSASKRDAILVRMDHGTATAECYARTNGANAVPGTNDAALPQDHNLLLTGFGRVSRSKNTKDSITGLISHSRSKTVVSVASSAIYEKGDICALICNDTTRLGHRETRKVSAINEGGSNRVSFTPGFSALPTTSDKIQNGLTYKLVADIANRTLSLLQRFGYSAKQLTGCAVQKFTPTVDGRGVHKHQFEIGIRGLLEYGTEYIKDDGSGGDSFTDSDSSLKVMDGQIPQPGALYNLELYDAVTGDLVDTEVKATVTAVTPSTGAITLTRGTNPIAATQLHATAATHEVAGTYDVSTLKNLDLNIDRRGWITIDVTSPTAPAVPGAATAAELVANINDALSKSPLYGQDVTAGVGISWEAAASVASSTKVRITSQIPGKQSQIAVRASSTLDVGVTTTGSKLFDAAFDERAVDEVRLVPWTPGTTEASGEPEPNYPGYVNVDGYRALVQEITPAMDNAIKWHEDEKADSQGPTGFGRPGKRSVDLTIKGKVYGHTAFWGYKAKQLANVDLTIQVGKVEGETHTYCLQQVKVVAYRTSQPQDDEMTFELTVRVGASSALEDEYIYGIN